MAAQPSKGQGRPINSHPDGVSISVQLSQNKNFPEKIVICITLAKPGVWFRVPRS
jgi:hypothetical protein